MQRTSLQVAERAWGGRRESGWIQKSIWQKRIHARNEIRAANVSGVATPWCVDYSMGGAGTNWGRGCTRGAAALGRAKDNSCYRSEEHTSELQSRRDLV